MALVASVAEMALVAALAEMHFCISQSASVCLSFVIRNSHFVFIVQFGVRVLSEERLSTCLALSFQLT